MENKADFETSSSPDKLTDLKDAKRTIRVTFLKNSDSGKCEEVALDVPFKLTERIPLIKSITDDQDSDCDEPIPLTEVDPSIFEKVMDFVDHQAVEELPEIERPIKKNLDQLVPEWYWNYINLEEDQETYFKLIEAANYLQVSDLQNLGCAFVA